MNENLKLNDNETIILNKIHDFVKKTSIGFAEDDVFENHIMGVKNYSIELAKCYNANIFVVCAAAYLHDIYHLQTRNHDIHEIEGAKFSKEYLKQFNIKSNDIELICRCILNHRGSKENKRESIEEKIIACADAMDHINRIDHMFYRISKVKNYDDAITWISAKIKRGWNKIDLEKGRDIVKKKYEASKILFNIK